MTYEDLLRALVLWVARWHPGRVVKRITIEYAEGEPDRLTVPTPEVLAPAVPAQLPPAAAPPVVAPPPEEDELTPLERAIHRLLADAGERLTTGQIIAGIAAKYPDREGFSESSTERAILSLRKSGALTLKPKSANDPLGKGYGLVEWDEHGR